MRGKEKIANRSIFASGMYKIIRSLLFLFDAEKVHYFSMNLFRSLCNLPSIQKLFLRLFNPGTSQAVKAMGLTFKNPVGLGAGFDKNALYLRELETMGFGFVEIGTVTPLPQNGNEKPRLFRLPKDRALINRMGFNNDGVDAIAKRLTAWRKKNPRSSFIIGGNIGKNKQTPNENAFRDYEICFEKLFHLVDYFVVNVSSPNTPGLRELQEKESLRKILTYLQMLNQRRDKAKPLLLKIAPDLTEEQLQDIADLCLEIKLDGLVVSNTTINREGLLTNQTTLESIGAGGLSGKPLFNRSNQILKSLIEKTNAGIPIIGSGGIFTGKDALEKRNSGAVLIQVWTGFIYQGPTIVKKIVRSLKNY
jgi:dihydroorotate dehydrogenase